MNESFLFGYGGSRRPRVLRGTLRRNAALVGAILSATVAHSAYAESPPAAPKADSAPAPSAEDLASQAYAAYSAGQFTDAISAYLKIYESTGAPAALLNIASIYDHNLHERDVASEYYRRYLRSPNVDPDRVKKVNERLATLKQESEQQSQAAVPVVAAPAAAPKAPEAVAPSTVPQQTKPAAHSSGGGGRVAGIVTGSVGLATLGASGVFSLLARKKNSDANAYCTGNICSDVRGVDLARQAGDLATGATITFVGGAVLLGAGITIYLASSGHEEPTAAAVNISPTVGPTGSGLGVSGKF